MISDSVVDWTSVQAVGINALFFASNLTRATIYSGDLDVSVVLLTLRRYTDTNDRQTDIYQENETVTVADHNCFIMEGQDQREIIP
jgi:hypothetical protein